MKVKATYKQFPGLKILKSEKDFIKLMAILHMAQESECKETRMNFIPDELTEVRNNIFLLSESYLEAMKKSQRALMELYTDSADIETAELNIHKIKKHLGDHCGVLILKGNTSNNEGTAIDYFFYKIKEGKVIVLHFMDLIEKRTKKLVTSLFMGCAHSVGDKEILSIPSSKAIELFKKANREIEELSFNLANAAVNVLLCIAFKKYAEVETKEIIDIVDPNKAPKNICKTLALQNTPFDFQITKLSADWYTEIIRTTGFEVRGHWRLQPYSNGKRRLIFIQPFMKHGYHRKAKIQAEQE